MGQGILQSYGMHHTQNLEKNWASGFKGNTVKLDKKSNLEKNWASGFKGNTVKLDKKSHSKTCC